MKFRNLVVGAAALGLLAGPVASAYAASPPAAPKATGDVTLSTPAQQLSFSAIMGTPAKGSVTYSNLQTGLSDPRTWTQFTTTLGDSVYPHTVSITSFTLTSPTSGSFSGTADAGTALLDGTINATTVVLTYTAGSYVANLTGTISPDGSVADGTATDSNNNSPLYWTAPAGSFTGYVLSYTANVTCAAVHGVDATFGYTVPSTPATVAWDIDGLALVWSVHDGSTPGAPADVASFTSQGRTTPSCPAPASPTSNPYPITAGNLVVH